jgi:hypothetical protein
MLNSGTNYAVKLQIQTNTGTDDLGTATFQFTFNNANLSFPASPTINVDYVAHNFHGTINANYGQLANWITKATATTVSVNIELLVDNAGTVVATGSNWTDVCTINFTTTNPAGNSNLQWGLIEAYDGDNSTQWTNGTFTNINTSPLPIELSLFSTESKGRDMLLSWETKVEVNSGKFEIERSAQKDNDNWVKVSEINASGNSNSPKKYSYTDKKLNSGRYNYRLKMIDVDGSFEYSEVVFGEISLPKDYALSQNYPNPFNPNTRIDYQLPIDSKVLLELFSIGGEKVLTVINEEQSAGYYTKEINGSNLASGVYIYRFISLNKQNENKFTQIKKMVILK